MEEGPQSTRLICHRCGFVRPADDADSSFCPTDGLFLVEEAEHLKAPRDPFLGTKLGGRYPILGLLGRGGMGTVYRSIQPLVERPVAIKTVLCSLGPGDATPRERFLAEAKAIARLAHPVIVTLFDFGAEDDGTLFMVMELVRGRTLREVFRSGLPPPSWIADVMLPVLEGLAAAHGQGIVHRDLKPENIMLLDPAGVSEGAARVRILDFGLAFALEGSLPRITKEGSALGTPEYMSPEQVTGGSIDQRTDIYSLGVILYEGLAGRLPFQTEPGQRLALLTKHLCAEPLPLVLPPGVPSAVGDVVRRAMAKAADDRFQRAEEMARALRHALGSTVWAVDALAPTLDIADVAGQVLALVEQPPSPAACSPVPFPQAIDAGSQPSAPAPAPAPDPASAPEPARIDSSDGLVTLPSDDLVTLPSQDPLRPAGSHAPGRQRRRAAFGVLGGTLILALVALAVWGTRDKPVPVDTASAGSGWANQGAGLIEDKAVAASLPYSGTGVRHPGPPAEPTVDRPPPPATEGTEVRLTSTPVRATVLAADGREQGVTPLVLHPEGPAGAQVAYMLRADGFLPQPLKLVVNGLRYEKRVVLQPAMKPGGENAVGSRALGDSPQPDRVDLPMELLQ